MAAAVGGQLLTDRGDSIHELWARLDGAPDAQCPDLSAVRSLRLFGCVDWELACIPARAARPGKPQAARAAFAPNRGPSIRAREGFWSRGVLVATPNRFAFAWRHCLLWQREGRAREASEELWGAVGEVVDELSAIALNNSVGASASIALAHVHLLEDRGSVWPSWPARVVAELGDGVELLTTDPESELPIFAVGVRGASPLRRAPWIRRLLEDRVCTAVNTLVLPSATWIVPRREETPSPDFAWALGAAELYGRFVYPERDAFDAATAARLEAALRRASFPPDATQFDALRRWADCAVDKSDAR